MNCTRLLKIVSAGVYGHLFQKAATGNGSKVIKKFKGQIAGSEVWRIII
jgi:hypothetical protein